jgi:hypothetical protein
LSPLERAEEKNRQKRVRIKENIINTGELQSDGSRLVNAVVWNKILPNFFFLGYW